ncbi:MAG: GNAT family N-acetyltransferase [Candidatus Competibacteraceae bacterium]|nr:GNAT family N-acetyltransferase [Candidatus Competibacteraceae bacterium]
MFVAQLTEEQLDNIWPLCTKIAQKMSYPSFFCSEDWLRSAANTLLPKEQILVLIVRSESNVKAVLPLVSKINKLGGNDLHFLGSTFFPDPIGLICEPVDRAKSISLIKEYLAMSRGWDRLILDWILEDEANDWNLEKKYISIAPFVKLPNNFDILLSAFSKKKRYNLKSMIRKFESLGGKFVILNDRKKHKEYLYKLFILHKKRSKEREINSSFNGYHIEKFHSEVVKDSNEVAFFGLMLNGDLIALIYGFEFNKTFFYYQISHDPNYGDLSPGSVLLFYVIRDCCSRGIVEFNFLQGDEIYKKIWTNQSRMLYRCVLTHKTWRACLLNIVDKAKKIIKDFKNFTQSTILSRKP